MEDSEQLIPRYLRFVKGVIDTDDLPLNVSRELLQKNKKIESIKNKILLIYPEIHNSSESMFNLLDAQRKNNNNKSRWCSSRPVV